MGPAQPSMHLLSPVCCVCGPVCSPARHVQCHVNGGHTMAEVFSSVYDVWGCSAWALIVHRRFTAIILDSWSTLQNACLQHCVMTNNVFSASNSSDSTIHVAQETPPPMLNAYLVMWNDSPAVMLASISVSIPYSCAIIGAYTFICLENRSYGNIFC